MCLLSSSIFSLENVYSSSLPIFNQVFFVVVNLRSLQHALRLTLQGLKTFNFVSGLFEVNSIPK
jgi:hypothetical protein